MKEKEKKEMKKEFDNAVEDTDLAVRPSCKMKVCENEKTGEIEIVYGKGCPKGYIEKIAGKIAVRGMRFRPKKRAVDDEDEDEYEDDDEDEAEDREQEIVSLEKRLKELKKKKTDLG